MAKLGPSGPSRHKAAIAIQLEPASVNRCFAFGYFVPVNSKKAEAGARHRLFLSKCRPSDAAGGGGYYAYHDGYSDYGPRRDIGPRYGGGYGWRRHVRACFRAYGSDYDPSTNTYIDDYGDERRCRL